MKSLRLDFTRTAAGADRLLDALLGQLVCRKSMELVWFLDRSH
ncbi:Uncharacterised protein [Salmonella enterica subsp. enterica]|uniref:Uncharacterized protein n=1 Tax=Salmonella enterica I TaxID=59201 RepID=A0A379VM63_SALET|nr:Uncharacterised protein [Salmonella enterica subsp. enterica]